MTLLEELEVKLSKSKNTIERAELIDKINKIKAEANKVETKKEFVPTRDAKPIADHNTKRDDKGARVPVRGDVFLSDSHVIL